MAGDFAQTKAIRPWLEIWTGDPTNVEQTLHHRDKKGGGYMLKNFSFNFGAVLIYISKIRGYVRTTT